MVGAVVGFTGNENLMDDKQLPVPDRKGTRPIPWLFRNPSVAHEREMEPNPARECP